MNKLLLSIALSLSLTGLASAAVTSFTDFNGAGGIIPDGSPAGISQTITMNQAGYVASVSLTLNISGGWNGDLYGYLSYNDGSSENSLIILNRIGVGGGNPAASGAGFGTGGAFTTYSDLHGIGITLVDGAGGSIHDATVGTHTYLDAANYRPDSAATFTSTFENMGANGTWSLTLFDRATGDQSTIVGWGLDIGVSTSQVPEPINVALGVFGGLFAAVAVGRRIRSRVQERARERELSDAPGNWRKRGFWS